MAEPVGGDLHLRSLTKHFASFTAVDDLDLTIPQGSFFALLGPSGCERPRRCAWSRVWRCRQQVRS
jgi:ABC-type transporter Mla maintaining outer membrane lipid asymmetry ATPase subunit MlaF